MIEQRLIADDFSLTVLVPSGSLGVHFPPDWPGDPLPIFPVLLNDLNGQGEVDGSFVIIHSASAQAIGLMGNKGRPDAAGAVEIGYGLVPAAHGQGYATEAVRELVNHLHTWPDVKIITAQTAVTNHASERVLEKVGFGRTGTAWDEEDGDLTVWAYSGN